MDSAVRLTVDEEATLRSWLAGNAVADIAKGRRVTATQVGNTIDRLCDFNRQAGARVLAAGQYTPRPQHPTAPRPALDRAPQPPTPVAARAPLAEYGGQWCPECRWVGYDTHHHPTVPVTVAILPREGT